MEISELNEKVRQRIIELFGRMELSERAFAITIGVNPLTMNRQIKGTSPISFDVIESILINIPDISSEWLLRGYGAMFKNDINSDANVHSEHEAEVQTAEEVPSKEVLLVPAGARGGSLEHFEAEVGLNPYNAEVIRSPFINADFAWPVKDDSMSPDYPAGTVLFVKRLVTNIIKWGNSYLFDTDDGFQFVRLRRSELGDEYIHCVPINAEDYEPYDVPKSDIHGIYKVLGAMRW